MTPLDRSQRSLLVRRYRIGAGLIAEFHFRPTAMTPLSVEWDPKLPAELRGAARRRYRKARASFGLLVAKVTGQRMVLIESFGLTQQQVADLSLALCEVKGSA